MVFNFAGPGGLGKKISQNGLRYNEKITVA
jgi:hypothetical protein